ncbi:hypothetical protein FUA23_10615 [Neolewinella aurantiaca]|uniref:Uncharacterized protein n=1 Tax=Neolewinella aurantiaca TaxID=2602767 RepID=A0A5C7FSI0_9BACT|nr:hypothetical protein [Neolewinella aurantiaca]TXF89410.1 hypothetical protein FUA23_10615 [Neolewinella aurantiaca]
MDKPLLEYFSFTARVLITGRFEPAGPWEGKDAWENKTVITYQMQDHFGGDPVGWFYEDYRNSSCGLGIETGEEWIIFAVADRIGNDHTGMCLGSFLLRNAEGEMTRHASKPDGLYRRLLELCGSS